ncbi:hypothetical protein DTO013E5_6297 [Penicillium roqueforti]|uniref:Fatty acid-binding protein n=1 Tax=Penicillium roqueforti (strain FM164) TaxID=1365484 RepID=W6QP70_PENRF|nr:uncharacterized protein LCP9604111_5262 [Penicillium roqueforti]CDM37766.1 Fatty acid-binding protein [Penicillium roqueforti FM164]KAF9248512.1 hypothetical protein LCP9604111_5262 [Penicillium roqueforti]KAI1831040.1 hypothetical protein CBS147337_8106 [Penicillium roqueforti]KAI2674109.1 hypothetical protein CBS147355_7284 [Penicillium roqueforti]KAI2682126.1 hypothetical protein LCP963914a_6541 [Penicillium roqueforti]
MSLKIDSHPSSAAFDVINETLQANEASRKDAINQAKAIFAFNLKNTSGEEASWYLDLKNKGEVGQGLAPAGSKADVTLSLSDNDFAQLVSGKANAQRLFMGGKLKIKGNIMKATKMEPILKKAQVGAKL